MRKIALRLVAVGLAAGLAAYMGVFGERENAGENSGQAEHADGVAEVLDDGTRKFRVGGKPGEVDQETIVGLCKSIPGVSTAELDVATSTLTLKVLPNVFRKDALSDMLSRPGQGWTIFAVDAP